MNVIPPFPNLNIFRSTSGQSALAVLSGHPHTLLSYFRPRNYLVFFTSLWNMFVLVVDDSVDAKIATSSPTIVDLPDQS